MLLFEIILPVFLLIFIGWMLAYFKLISNDTANHLVLYIFWAAGPAIVFLSISNYSIIQMLVWRFWLAYPLGILITIIFSYFLLKYIFNETKLETLVASFSVTIKNVIMVGFPIIISITGQKATLPLIIIIIICNCCIIPILIFIFELNTAIKKLKFKKKTIFVSLINTVKNPFVFAAFLGVIFSIFHLHMPLFFKKSLVYLSNSFVPCSLFSVGIGCYSFKIEGNFKKILTVSLLTVILPPSLAISLSYILKLSPFYSIALVIFSAVPTAKSMYIYTSKYHLFEKEVAAIISLTTILSIMTLPFFICLCYYLWPSTFQRLIL